eukprot:8168746-Pyramimonas_sp.AAC.1
MDNVSKAMNVPIMPTTDSGVFTALVSLDLIPEFVELVGIYSCSKFTPNSSSRKQVHFRIRYECYRGLAPKTQAPEAPDSAQRRDGGKLLKCDCTAAITGNYKCAETGNSTLVRLKLDLRHKGHKPGTPADARLLPIIPEVRQKLNDITCLFRNINLVRNYLDRWVRRDFLPSRLPHYTQALHCLDRRLNPTDRDIEYSIANSGKKLQFKQGWSWVLRPAQGDANAYVYRTRGKRVSAARVTLDNYAVMTSMLEFGNLSTDNTYYKRNVVKTFYKSHLPTPDDAAAALPPEAAPPAA